MLLLQDLLAIDDGARYTDEAGVVKMARVEKKENILEKSIGRLKETGTVWFYLGRIILLLFGLWIHLHRCTDYMKPTSLYPVFSVLLNKQDVWQGTQLLAIDVAAATGLLRRALIGDELTEKEKKTLKRTLTDMASVIPIGVLMLIPVSWTHY